MRWLPLLVGASVATSPAAAATDASTIKPDEARKVVLDYAACVVKRAHAKAAEVLLANADNAAILRDFHRLIDSYCVGPGVASIKFDADQFRYALADALVASEFAGGGPADFSDRPPLAHFAEPTPAELASALAKAKSPKQRDRVLSNFHSEEAVAALSRYGECVVRVDPTDARSWILTKPGSPEEATRIDALRASFGACLKSGTVTFSKATLRGTVALNYYRLAHAPIQATVPNVN
jgi:hypothetical protein